MTAPKASPLDVSEQVRNDSSGKPGDATRTTAPAEPRDDMGAPTEPALGPDGTGGALHIKRATLYSESEPLDGGSSPIRHVESYVGFVLDGRYHIESIIAQGGMGVVYLARHRLIDKHVAVKILRPELANNREITARFLTEAQAASAIGSEHIVNVTDYGELPDGATYIVMEYLNGLSLNQRIRQSEGPLPIPIVLDIARQLAEGLQRAHDANIVHRDLKPDNVLLVNKGKREDFVKILDFGIAKVQSSQNHTTTAGRIFGTPHYMSPEQGRGQELNHRTDIYSLGVILYEMVCGSVPFEGENPLGILTQHMYVDAKPLSERCTPGRVTPALECVVARCMLKEPEGRYASMAELDEDLRRLQDFEPPLAVEYFRTAANPPAHIVPLLRLASTRKSSGRPWLWGAAGTLLVAALAAFYVRGVDAPVAPSEVDMPPPDSSAPANAAVEVTIVAEPIDAHIFEGEIDLGVNPHTLSIAPQQVRTITVRRPGYKDLSLTIDGTKTRVEAKLKRLGAELPRVSDALATTPREQTEPTPVVDVTEALPTTTAANESVSPSTEVLQAAPVVTGVLQPPDALDPAWGYAPDPPGPPPSGGEPAPTTSAAPLSPDQPALDTVISTPPGPPPMEP